MGMSSHWHTVEGQYTTGLAEVRVVKASWDRPIDTGGCSHLHHLELNLLPVPGGARACFPEFWGPDRFEPFGDLFFLPADQHIHFKSNCRQQNSVVCDFDRNALDQWFGRELEWNDNVLQNFLNIANPRIRALLFQVMEEIRNPGFGGDAMLELLVSQLAIELTRHIRGIDEVQVAGGLSPWRLRVIDQRLAQIGSQPSLEELADLCNLSVRQLTRSFRISRGRSVGSYIAEHRAEQARNLIATGMSIKSVAYTLGFSAPSNFTAAFVRATGETPRQYRQRVVGTM